MRSLALISLIVVFGCAQDPKSTFCQPSTLTTEDGGITTMETYLFEGGRLMKVTSSTDRETVYEYTPAGDLGKATTKSSGQTYVTTYTHDSIHYLAASLYGYNGDTVFTTYWYNEVGQFTREERRIKNSTEERLAKLYYTYPDLITHNPSSIALVDLGDSIVTHFEYDNKVNPKRELYLPTIQAYNNITKETGPNSTIALTYTYNSNGYPLTSTQTTGLKQTWTYACHEF